MTTNSHIEWETFMQIYYSDEMRKKYIIKYDCDKMPPNLLNFNLLDLSDKKTKFSFGNYIQLDLYENGVIIELETDDFEIILNGNWYRIAKGKKYIPKLNKNFKLSIKLVPNLKIYIRNNDSDKNHFINSMLKYINVILDNFVVLENYNDPLKTNKNRIVISMEKSFISNINPIKIDENKFYYDYQEYNYNNNKIDDNNFYLDCQQYHNMMVKRVNHHIFLFDTLVQSEIIQICENNY